VSGLWGSIKVLRFLGIKVSEFQDTCLDFKLLGFQSSEVSSKKGIEISQNQGFRVFRFLGIKVLKFLEIKVSGC
jgi:hypothetical protein